MGGNQHGYYIVDVVWIQLKRPSLRQHGPRIYDQVKSQVSALQGFVKAFWASDADEKTKFAILTGKLTAISSKGREIY